WTGAPPATGILQTCVRVPSFQLSQWRNRRRSARRPLTFAFSRSFTLFSRHETSAQSGKTSEVATNQFPSGDHLYALISVGKEVFLCGSPPARSKTQIWDPPSRLARNASFFPSGRMFGSDSRLSPEVILRVSPPPAGSIHIAERIRFSSRSAVATAQASHRPSGDKEKPPTRATFASSSNRNGVAAVRG